MKEHQKEYYKSLGQIILSKREDKGLSQQQLANDCNVDRAKISRIENGREDFMHSTLFEIAKALDVKVKDLEPDF